MQRALPAISAMHSTRSMAFSIKGLYYFKRGKKSEGEACFIVIKTDGKTDLLHREVSALVEEILGPLQAHFPEVVVGRQPDELFQVGVELAFAEVNLGRHPVNLELRIGQYF